MNLIRQGDVLLFPVPTLPAGCIQVPPDGNRIVLAHGEVTGHAHAIYDHFSASSHIDAAGAMEITQAAIARAKAKLWMTPSGERYLEVTEPVTLRHEEHTEHILLKGVYRLPRQVEYSPAAIRNVTD